MIIEKIMIKIIEIVIVTMESIGLKLVNMILIKNLITIIINSLSL